MRCAQGQRLAKCLVAGAPRAVRRSPGFVGSLHDFWHDPAVPASRRCTTGTASESASESRKKAVVLSKRLPEDFVENTLMPHLEGQLLYNIHAYTPAELTKISRAYAKQNPRQYALCMKLSDQVKDRMPGFEAIDIIGILGSMWVLAPSDDELFEAFEERILLKIKDFTAPNLMGLVRIFNKRSSKHFDFLSKVMPKLRELLREYEAMELSEMLVSMAQSAEAARDMDILMCLVPEIERRYSEVSLVHAVNNLWALTQLKVVHDGLLSRLAEDLTNSHKIEDLTPKYMCRIAWLYRRCNAWDKVSGSLLPLIRKTTGEFRCSEFARLAQALPEEKDLLTRIADLLRAGMDEMGRKDFMMFFLGCVHGELLEQGRKDMEDPDNLVAQCIQYIKEEQDGFKRDEVQKLVYLLRFSKSYEHLLDDLPVSWNSTKEQTLDYIKAKS